MIVSGARLTYISRTAILLINRSRALGVLKPFREGKESLATVIVDMAPAQTLEQSKAPKYHEGGLIPDVEEHGDNPVVIRLTDDEGVSGRTRPETLQRCLEVFHKDGFVVLENAIDDDLVDGLYDRMVEDNEVYMNTSKSMQYNQGMRTD